MTVEAALSKVDAVGREVAAPSNQESILVYGRILKKVPPLLVARQAVIGGRHA